MRESRDQMICHIMAKKDFWCSQNYANDCKQHSISEERGKKDSNQPCN